jgi:hypothetical protein
MLTVKVLQTFQMNVVLPCSGSSIQKVLDLSSTAVRNLNVAKQFSLLYTK